jgi:hypothetical protein
MLKSYYKDSSLLIGKAGKLITVNAHMRKCEDAGMQTGYRHRHLGGTSQDT